MGIFLEWLDRRNEANAQLGQKDQLVQVTNVKRGKDGTMTLEIRTEDGRSGWTSGLVDFTAYKGVPGYWNVKTESGSHYIARLDDRMAKVIAKAFYSPTGKAAASLHNADVRGGNGPRKSPQFVMPSTAS